MHTIININISPSYQTLSNIWDTHPMELIFFKEILHNKLIFCIFKIFIFTLFK